MNVIDSLDRVIRPGNNVLFSLEGDLYQGKVGTFTGKLSPTASLTYIDNCGRRAQVKKFKLSSRRMNSSQNSPLKTRKLWLLAAVEATQKSCKKST